MALLELVLAALSFSVVSAVTWNQTTFVSQTGLNIQFGIPDDSWTPCQYPGICAPYVVTVKPQTTWYWCGFKATHRTQYWLRVQGTKGANVSGLLMRTSELYGCAVPAPPGVAACGTIDTSLCDTQQSCYVQVIGLVFPDDLCLLVSNNDGKGLSANVSVQIWNFEDRARNIGTVFVILLTVIFCLAILAYFTIACRREWTSPTHRIDDLLELQKHRDDDDAQQRQATADEHDTFASRFAQLRHRVRSLVSRNPSATTTA